MHIKKLATCVNHLRREMDYYPNARSAFKAYLSSQNFTKDDKILMPAFIGWSPREGSGVFDPVSELNLSTEFYAIDESLYIDIVSLTESLKKHQVKVLVIIHYFGFVDPNYENAVALGRQFGVAIIEDEAHALLTDLVGGVCGRLGDVALFSLHKMLPVSEGGILVHNHPGTGAAVCASERERANIWEFDIFAIAKARRTNALLLEELLAKHHEQILPIRPLKDPNIFPQTYPVIIRLANRDQLYQLMNEAGYGVVSLYHTLIPEISPRQFPKSHTLAQHILNLPVHQDAQASEIIEMVKVLVKVSTLLQTDAY